MWTLDLGRKSVPLVSWEGLKPSLSFWELKGRLAVKGAVCRNTDFRLNPRKTEGINPSRVSGQNSQVAMMSGIEMTNGTVSPVMGQGKDGSLRLNDKVPKTTQPGAKLGHFGAVLHHSFSFFL